MTAPPQPTGKPPAEISLTGMLFAWKAGQPVLIEMPGSDLRYLACFSTAARLREMHGAAGIVFDGIKMIEDEADFLSSIPASITVIVNPYTTAEGRMRFMQVHRS